MFKTSHNVLSMCAYSFSPQKIIADLVEEGSKAKVEYDHSVTDLQKQLEEKMREVQSLQKKVEGQEDYSDLSGELSKTKEELAGAHDLIVKLRAEADSQQRQIATLKQETQALRDTQEKSTQKLESLLGESHARTQAAEEENKRMQGLVDQMKARLGDSAEVDQRLSKVTAENESLAVQVRELLQQLASEKLAIEDLRQQNESLSSLSKEKDVLAEDLQKSKQQLVEREQTLIGLKDQVSQLTDVVSETKQQLSRAESAKSEATDELKAAQIKADAQSSELAASRRREGELKKAMQLLEHENQDRLREAGIKLQQAQEEVATVSVQLKNLYTLQAAGEKDAVKQAELTAAKENASRLASLNAALVEKLKEQEALVEAQASKIEEQEKSFEQQKEALEARVAGLQKDAEETGKSRAEVERRLGDVMGQLDEAKRMQVASDKRIVELKQVQEQKVALQQKADDLQRIIEAGLSGKMDSEEARLLREQNAALVEEVTTLGATMAGLNGEISALRANGDSSSQELARLRAQFEAAETQHFGQSEVQDASLSQRLEVLVTRLEQASRSQPSDDTDIADALGVVLTEDEPNEDDAAVREELEHALAVQKYRFEEMEKEFAEHQHRSQMLEGQILALQKERQALQAQLKAEQIQGVDLVDLRDSHERAVKQLQSDNQELQLHIGRLRVELEDTQKQSHQLEKGYLEEKRGRADLESRLKLVLGQNKKAQADLSKQEREFVDLQQKQQAAEMRLKHAHQEALASQKEASRRAVEDLEVALEKAKKAVEAKKREASQLRRAHEEEVASLTKELQAAKQQKGENSAGSDLELTRTMVVELKKNESLLKTAMKNLERELGVARTKALDARKQLSAAKAQAVSATAAQSSVEESDRHGIEQIKKLRARLAEMDAEVQALRASQASPSDSDLVESQLESAQRKLKSTERQLHEASESVRLFEQQKAHLEKLNLHYKGEIDQLTDELARLRREKAQEQTRGLQRDLEASDKGHQNESLKLQVSQLEREVTFLRAAASRQTSSDAKLLKEQLSLSELRHAEETKRLRAQLATAIGGQSAGASGADEAQRLARELEVSHRKEKQLYMLGKKLKDDKVYLEKQLLLLQRRVLVAEEKYSDEGGRDGGHQQLSSLRLQLDEAKLMLEQSSQKIGTLQASKEKYKRKLAALRKSMQLQDADSDDSSDEQVSMGRREDSPRDGQPQAVTDASEQELLVIRQKWQHMKEDILEKARQYQLDNTYKEKVGTLVEHVASVKHLLGVLQTKRQSGRTSEFLLDIQSEIQALNQDLQNMTL